MLTDENLAELAPRINAVLDFADKTDTIGPVLGAFVMLALPDEAFLRWEQGGYNAFDGDEFVSLLKDVQTRLVNAGVSNAED